MVHNIKVIVDQQQAGAKTLEGQQMCVPLKSVWPDSIPGWPLLNSQHYRSKAVCNQNSPAC